MKNNQLVKISAILLLVTSFLPSAKASPVLSFSNKEALKFQKTLKEGETEIIEFAEPVSLAHYGSSDKSMDNIELEKLEASAAGYKKFLIKAKRAGSTELTFLAGKELIKVKVFVQNNYDALEDELNKLFGMKEATEEERIKVISTNQNANIDSSPKTHIYLKGKVANAKNAMLAVAFAANVLGDKGVKIFSNPGGQLRQKNLEQPENDTSNNSSQNQESSFAEFYENTNKLIDSNNLYRDLILASEEEKVISYIQIKEPKRYAIKVRFLEMDARYVDEFLSSLSATSTASDLAGSFGTATLASPSLGSGTGGFSGSSILQQIGVKGVTELSSQIVGGSLVSGAVKILDKAFLNVNLNDLLREGALRIVNEFSLVTHSGEMVSLGKGTRFPIPKQNNGIGNTSITVEYIPIGFKGE
ncbi:MAG: type II and III secretion system protein, partial [Candidatus Caenarcaniphilales bacterium]|nr:type II and III secretion system protein [Candidatus Caenarcaniphilales bacterium]